LILSKSKAQIFGKKPKYLGKKPKYLGKLISKATLACKDECRVFRTSKEVSGSGRYQKLLEKFLRIYEFFENSENSFRITEEVSGSGRAPKVCTSNNWQSKSQTHNILVFEISNMTNFHYFILGVG
jgi:hypothetical protein